MKTMVVCLLGLLVAAGLAQAQTPTPDCDFNKDGAIDHEDLFVFMSYWHTESSIPPPTPTPTVPTYTISGHVAEFPGCGGSMRGVWVALLPLAMPASIGPRLRRSLPTCRRREPLHPGKSGCNGRENGKGGNCERSDTVLNPEP